MFKKIRVMEPEKLNDLKTYAGYQYVMDMSDECQPFENVHRNTEFEDCSDYDPLSYFCFRTRTFFDLEAFSILLLEELDYFSKKELRSRVFYDRQPVFWLIASLVEMIGLLFPYDEKSLNSLEIMLSAMEIHEDQPEFKNAVDLMFEDLVKDEGEDYRPCVLYSRFRSISLGMQKFFINYCIETMQKKMPDLHYAETEEPVALLNISKEYVHPKKNSQGNLLRESILYMVKKQMMPNKTVFRMTGKKCDCLQYPMLWSQENDDRFVWMTTNASDLLSCKYSPKKTIQ